MVKKKKPIKPAARQRPKQGPTQALDKQALEKTAAVDAATSNAATISGPALAAALDIEADPQRPSKLPKREENRKSKTSPDKAARAAASNAPKKSAHKNAGGAPHSDSATSAVRGNASPRKPAGIAMAASERPTSPDTAASAPAISASDRPSDETTKSAGRPTRSTVNEVGRDDGEAGASSMPAPQPFEDFAAETQRIARESFEETTNLLSKLRSAKNPMEVMALQTTYMQHSLRMYTAFAQGFGKLLAMSQSTLVKQGQVTIEGLGSSTHKT